MFFDLNIRGSTFENNVRLAKEASKYCWNHINFSYNQNDFSDALKYKKELTDELKNTISIDYTLEIESNNINDIRKTAQKYRNRANCISVIGGDLKVNRAVLENVKIDILSRPYLKRFDSGLNHVLAKEAVRNNVAVEICFNDILKSYLSYRSKILSNFKDVYTLYKKFDFPLVLSSRAESVFDIKTVHDFQAFFIQTGLTEHDVQKSFQTAENILNLNKNRDNLILNGVRRVVDET